MRRIYLVIGLMLLAFPHLSYGFDSLPTAIPNGTNGQVLTARTDDTPHWAAPGGSAIKQLKHYKASSSFTTTSTSYVDVTSFSVDITPTSTSNTVFVSLLANVWADAGVYCSMQIVRSIGGSGDTVVIEYANMPAAAGAAGDGGSAALASVDAPSTVSAVNYRVQMKKTGGTNTCNININSLTNGKFIYAMEVVP